MALSPMMEKYLETKKEYADCVLFYRLGDFYELFFDDAVMCSKELGLTLTGKDCGLPERAPMCGVPFHAVDQYLTKLAENGHKVAIAEQMEDPKLAKGLVKREVIRVVTPGTVLDTSALDESKNRYLLSVVYEKNVFGISLADVTTGAFLVTEVSSAEEFYDELFRFQPSEIIYNSLFPLSGADLNRYREKIGYSMSELPDRYFRQESAEKTILSHFDVKSLESLGLSSFGTAVLSAGALLTYLIETQKNDLKHIVSVEILSKSDYMLLDASTRRNLELTETLREKQKSGTLFSVLDRTKTAMGARTLRKAIEQPLLIRDEIIARQEAVSELKNAPMMREELREYLNPVYDLERLMGKISYKTANPRDLIAFQKSIAMVPHIKRLLSDVKSAKLAELRDSLDDLSDLCELLEKSIKEDPPVLMHEGNMILDGYDERVDTYRKAKTEGKLWLSEVEAEEREKTGIKTLRVRFNKVFGYYIEVTNSFLDQVPDYFVRKQTLVGAERFITPRLKELEDMILGAEEKLYALEFELFQNVRETIAKEVRRIETTACSLSFLDAFASLAYVAEQNGYVRPKINDRGVIEIKNGRHPVIEKALRSEPFVPNDTMLDKDENRVLIITGPNMAGKSTYMRQTAIITLMALIGSFVPADEANISVVDRIFTRVGASDDLSSGRSTFMVEMTEVANILRNATKKSLIILDEIGRGTSTFDGMSIAWAVLEYIADAKRIGAKTLFATHYHELTELEGAVPGVKNYCISVREQGDSVLFLRKIVRGGADKSYGIHVAKLAGVPKQVLDRANELVLELAKTDIVERAKEIAEFSSSQIARTHTVEKLDAVDLNQMSFLDARQDESVIDEIASLDLTRMTPLDALNTLYKLQSEVKNRI